MGAAAVHAHTAAAPVGLRLPIPAESRSAVLLAVPSPPHFFFVLFDNDKRPAWLNWLFLAIFLWSSWQLAGMWFSQLHGG